MIRIENLNKSYGPKLLIKDLTYHFPANERVALVGANGAGKTTLLNILCGFEECDSGTFIRPREVVLGYLPQEPNANPALTIVEECLIGGGRLQEMKRVMDEAMERMTVNYSEDNHAVFEKAEIKFRNAGGYGLEARAKGILAGLGFLTEMFTQNPRSLSGGWRMRLELAKVFLNSPDFLILDEPTNHLDLPSLIWVEKYLQRFEGTVLFVSHDRDLLNRLSTVTLHLHRGKLTDYKGNFDSFLDQREARMEQEVAAAESLRKRREHLEDFVRRFGAQATKAKQAQSRVKMISRIKDLESDVDLDEGESSVGFRLPEPPPSGREVLTVTRGAVGYGKPLSRNIELKVNRGQKVAIIGANGIGKSTLLKTIAGRLKALDGEFTLGFQVELAYFAQDQLDVMDEHDSVLGNVMRASTQISEKQARQILGSLLFRGDDVFKPVGVLSGGEKSRVGLACLLVQKSNFLLLDEPTNHLDMSSCEILSEAVSEYEGTVLFVSHDRTFINETCTHVFAMLPDGRSSLFPGKLDDYERMAAVSGFPNVLSGETVENFEPGNRTQADVRTDSEKRRATNQANKRDRQKLERTIAKLEEEMHSISQNISKSEDRMAQQLSGADAANFQQVRTLQTQHSDLKMALVAKEEEWLIQSEKLSTLDDSE